MYSIEDSDLRFEWDPDRARRNEGKHGVSFEEATTVFLDEEGLLIEDPGSMDGDVRFVLLGISVMLRLMVVVHCLRTEGRGIRIISARKATRGEAVQYAERLRK